MLAAVIGLLTPAGAEMVRLLQAVVGQPATLPGSGEQAAPSGIAVEEVVIC